MTSPTDKSVTPPQVRANAAFAIRQIISNNRTIDWVEKNHPQWFSHGESRALTLEVLRHYFSLSAAVDRLLNKPLRGKDQDLYALVLVGAYQLAYSSTPDHAAINETVQACLLLRKPWARSLVNGLLRTLNKTERSDGVDTAHSEHNPFFESALRTEFPAQYDALVTANNTRAPMCLRINTSRVAPDVYRAHLSEVGIEFNDGAYPESVVLTRPQPAATLPGWTEGMVAVQDGGAQFAAHLMFNALRSTAPSSRAPGKPARILDACAAPGGKYFHLRELCAAHELPIEVTVLEREAKRMASIKTIGQRLGHCTRASTESATENDGVLDADADSFLVGDATTLDWWHGEPFDLILVDAPCSGSGTVRRHPEIKIHLSQADVAQHQRLQLQILSRLWHALASGGTLLYCTCSLLRAENDRVIEQFIERQMDQASNGSDNHANDIGAPSVLPIALPVGHSMAYGWQLLPTFPETDGFYYALITKTRHVPNDI